MEEHAYYCQKECTTIIVGNIGMPNILIDGYCIVFTPDYAHHSMYDRNGEKIFNFNLNRTNAAWISDMVKLWKEEYSFKTVKFGEDNMAIGEDGATMVFRAVIDMDHPFYPDMSRRAYYEKFVVGLAKQIFKTKHNVYVVESYLYAGDEDLRNRNDIIEIAFSSKPL